MITISDRKTLDFYLQKPTNKLNPYQIIELVVKKYGKEFDIESNRNLFFNEFVKSNKKLYEKSKDARYNFFTEINNTQFYIIDFKYKNFTINLLVSLNNVYDYCDFYIVNPLKYRKYCSHFRVYNKINKFPQNRTYIFWIKTKDPYFDCQDNIMRGSDILNFITDLSILLNIEIIELEESSYRYCSIDKKSKEPFMFSTLDWITKGKTWYERNNFKSTIENSIRDEDRYNLPLIDYEKVSKNKYKTFTNKYKETLNFIRNISVNKLASYYRQLIYNPKDLVNKYNISKTDLSNFIISLNMIEKYLKDHKNNKLKNFVNWLYYNIDCYYYIIFIKTIRDFDPIWNEPKSQNDKASIHFYNKRIFKDNYIEKIASSFVFLTQRNYFYKLI